MKSLSIYIIIYKLKPFYVGFNLLTYTYTYYNIFVLCNKIFFLFFENLSNSKQFFIIKEIIIDYILFVFLFSHR